MGWFPVYFGFCPSVAAWKHDAKRLSVPNIGPYPTADARCTHLTNPAGKRCCVVTVGEHIDKREPNGIASLITHEAAHVWQAVRENIGEDSPSHEFEAYAMQAISGQLIDAYEKTRRRLFRAR